MEPGQAPPPSRYLVSNAAWDAPGLDGYAPDRARRSAKYIWCTDGPFPSSEADPFCTFC